MEHRDFFDRNYAGDLETIVSITGFIIYLLNAPICWQSKSQKGVTLSSTEAKYVVISEAVKEVEFVYHFYVIFNQSESSNCGKDGKHWSDIYVRKCFNLLFCLARGHTLSLCPSIH
jgi:hypothetical protein